MAAMPALPSTPGAKFGDKQEALKWNYSNESNMILKALEQIVTKTITWHRHAVHSHIRLIKMIAKYALHLCRRDVFSSPSVSVPTAVTEVHVAKFIHHQYVTLGEQKVG